MKRRDPQLTPVEHEVMELCCRDHSDKEIASIRGTSYSAVRRVMERIGRKLEGLKRIGWAIWFDRVHRRPITQVEGGDSATLRPRRSRATVRRDDRRTRDSTGKASRGR